MKLRYLLPFLFFFHTQNSPAQFKAESNLHSFDLKSRYVDTSVRDTFGLRDFYNIQGVIRAKYNGNSIYAARNGLLNHFYGGNVNLGWMEFYYNNSKQNTKTESNNVRASPLGEISTQTTLLNDDQVRELGLTLRYNDFFIISENANQKSNINGHTLIRFNEQQDLIPFSLDFANNTGISGIGFKHGFFKFIQNRKDSNEFHNYFFKANHSGFNVYYGKDMASFFNFNVFDKVNINLIYDKRWEVSLSTNDYSCLKQRDFERALENRLRLVKRVYDSQLEETRSYLGDMFFAEGYNFSVDKRGVTASLNLENLLMHYSKESQKLGLRYKFAIATWDFKQKEAHLGVFFE